MDKDFGKKVWWMKKLTRRLLIVTNLDDFSLAKCWCFAKFTNLPCQTFPLYGRICYTMWNVSCSNSEVVQYILSKKNESKSFNGKVFTVGWNWLHCETINISWNCIIHSFYKKTHPNAYRTAANIGWGIKYILVVKDFYACFSKKSLVFTNVLAMDLAQATLIHNINVSAI